MRIGATLSGGFVKGVAHIGFLEALEYKGIPPSFVAGSSAGALVGALYSFGLSTKKILEIAKGLSWKDLARPSLKGGLFKLEGLYSILKEIVGDARIEELPLPFGLAVVNLRTLKVEFKREGPLADLVVASCSVPPLFSPWKVGGDYYADGGLRNCLPAEMAKAAGVEFNVCCSVNGYTYAFNPNSLLDVAVRASLATVIENQETRERYCDIIVNLSLEGNPLSFDMVELFYRTGYDETLKTLEGGVPWL
ncbi:patatin-like phospholipase family protein [Thermovibrio ammonificans]